jgi:hypothetical protein
VAKKIHFLLCVAQLASRKLDKNMETVEEFVEHLHFLDKLIHEMTALENESAIIIKLFTIIKDFDIAVDPESLALYKILSPALHQLKVIKFSNQSEAIV